jgi:hypothetical protein
LPRRLGGVARDQEIFFQGEGDMEMGEVGPDGACVGTGKNEESYRG